MRNIVVTLLALLVLAGCSSSKRGSFSSGAESSLTHEFEKVVGDRVFFALDSSDLSGEARAQLQKQVEWLASHPSIKVTVEGHCDERGTREYNLALGERRASAVMKFMQKGGLEASRVDTISYGKERPAVIGNDESAWGQNRRAVTVLK